MNIILGPSYQMEQTASYPSARMRQRDEGRREEKRGEERRREEKRGEERRREEKRGGEEKRGERNLNIFLIR